ncbi:MAG: hypothetical protein R3C58_09845 [Parvularculaceae bacterium]
MAIISPIMAFPPGRRTKPIKLATSTMMPSPTDLDTLSRSSMQLIVVAANPACFIFPANRARCDRAHQKHIGCIRREIVSAPIGARRPKRRQSPNQPYMRHFKYTQEHGEIWRRAGRRRDARLDDEECGGAKRDMEDRILNDDLAKGARVAAELRKDGKED